MLGRGEIIGDKYGFRTGRWGATEADDMKHWSRFPAFSKQLRASLIKPNLNFKVSERSRQSPAPRIAECAER